jgi:uncharacterized protein
VQNIIIDTGPIVALFDPHDTVHRQISNCIKGLTAQLVTTMPVVTEVMHLIRSSIRTQINFLEWIERGGLRIDQNLNLQVARMKTLIRKYSDMPMDFADASIVLLAEDTGIRQILTIDSDFAVYRIKGKNYFKYVRY